MIFESLNDFLMRHDERLKTLCRAGFALCVLVVCVLSLIPEEELPDVAMSDKVHHLIAYSAIATLGLLGYRGPRAVVAVIVGVIALGGALEICQLYIPGRSADILDFAVNVAGVALGLILASLAMRLWTPRKTPAGTPPERAS